MRDETGSDSAGQSGDTQQLRDSALADSESIEELVEEGSAYEAGILSGVENAPDADVAEVRTREVPEDDVPRRIPRQRTLTPAPTSRVHFFTRFSVHPPR
jgi:hypothetical protein